jgi:tRNA threonylcarbamoyl adenosine modification protein (Sua5/YciO/YrdC/YwlC family)
MHLNLNFKDENMAQILQIHPKNPEKRLISQAVAVLRQDGAIMVYPTDSAYALGCKIADKDAQERICHIRNIEKNHNFTLICRDLSEASQYAEINNIVFRLLKAHTPGPYTFILPATKEVPKRLQHAKRKTIGLRIPQNNITMSLLEELGAPLMSVTLILPAEEFPLADPEEISAKISNRVNLIIDGGFCEPDPTSVIEFSDNIPKIIRAGKGDISSFV